jgi:hypothetical protein
LKLEFTEREEEIPDLRMSKELRKKLNENQKANVNQLINSYIENGLSLLREISLIVSQLNDQKSSTMDLKKV